MEKIGDFLRKKKGKAVNLKKSTVTRKGREATTEQEQLAECTKCSFFDVACPKKAQKEYCCWCFVGVQKRGVHGEDVRELKR